MGSIATIAEAIEDIRKGRMVILVDDEDRENEGDVVVAAEKVSPQSINFMATYARGLICVALPGDKVDKIGLPPMARDNKAPLETAFTLSVDAARGIQRGVSAQDRSHTIQELMKDTCTMNDLRTPGHIFPLRARKGGVLERAGQTEGGVDLSRLAGLKPGAVICEIMNEDGTMARLDSLLEFGDRHNMKVVTNADLIAYRMQKESLVTAVADVELPTQYGLFRAVAFRNELDTQIHLALVKGEIRADQPTLLRVHRSDLVSDVFGFTGDHGMNRLDHALEEISDAASGVILYLRTGSNGEIALDPLTEFLKREQDGSSSTKMGFREFGIGAQILSQLGLKKIQVMTNNPGPFHGLKGFGLEIVGWVPLDKPSS